jgi:hypothetical protein
MRCWPDLQGVINYGSSSSSSGGGISGGGSVGDVAHCYTDNALISQLLKQVQKVHAMLVGPAKYTGLAAACQLAG